MNRWVTATEIRLELRLIAKQPVLSLVRAGGVHTK